jgi:hypothetical protein
MRLRDGRCTSFCRCRGRSSGFLRLFRGHAEPCVFRAGGCQAAWFGSLEIPVERLSQDVVNARLVAAQPIAAGLMTRSVEE